MGQDSSLCVPTLCSKEDDNGDGERNARQDFHRLANGVLPKSDSRLLSLSLSPENTKAITCAHLIGNIIKSYFESEDNECDQMGKFPKTVSIQKPFWTKYISLAQRQEIIY